MAREKCSLNRYPSPSDSTILLRAIQRRPKANRERAIYREKQDLLSGSVFTLHPPRLQRQPPLPHQRPRERLHPWPSASRFRCRPLRRRRRLRHRRPPRRTPPQVLHCLPHLHPQPPLRVLPVLRQGRSLLSSREGLCLVGRCLVSSLDTAGPWGTGWGHRTFSRSLFILFLLLIIFVIILVLLVAYISAKWWASARDSPEV